MRREIPAYLAAAGLTRFARLTTLSTDFATRRRIDEHFAAHGVRPDIAVEANSVSALVEIATRTGLATVLPDAIAREQPRLRPVPLEPALPARSVALLRREAAFESAAARAFAELARGWGGAGSATEG